MLLVFVNGWSARGFGLSIDYFVNSNIPFLSVCSFRCVSGLGIRL